MTRGAKFETSQPATRGSFYRYSHYINSHLVFSVPPAPQTSCKFSWLSFTRFLNLHVLRVQRVPARLRSRQHPRLEVMGSSCSVASSCESPAALERIKDTADEFSLLAFFFFKYVFIWLCWVLVVARRFFVGSPSSPLLMWGLSCPKASGLFIPWPEIEPVSPALEGDS